MKNIIAFNDFMVEYVTINQGANLSLDFNPPQNKYDGGDGPSSEQIPDKTNKTVKYIKKFRGVKKNQKIKIKKSTNDKINKMTNNLTNTSVFGNNGQGNSPGGGGADYTLQGF